MGFVSGLLGTAGGVNGTGISGPSSANILNPTTVDQANTAYNSNQNALAQQQAFLQATQAQNGLGNQTSVFNQLQGVTNGTGPNPAQAQLAQATAANTANQAALMAGQRGAGANSGLIARQAAMQGANNQQNAAGQAATLQANQSLNALNSQGNIANTQAAQQAAATGANTSAQQGEQGQLLNSIAQQNNANVTMQTGINNANAGLAGQTMTGQQNMFGNITGGIGSALGLAQGGKVSYASGGGVYADPSTDNFDTANKAVDSIPGNYTLTPEAIAANKASLSPTLAQPGSTTPTNGPKSKMGQAFGNPNWGSPQGSSSQPQGAGQVGNVIGKAIGTGLKHLFSSTPQQPQQIAGGPMDNTQPQMQSNPGDIYPSTMMAARGGKVPAMVSAGEIRIKAQDVPKVAKGEKSPLDGEKIKGRVVVPGAKNDYANDIIPKTLSEGDIILPRSVTQSKNPHWAAHKFVSDIMAQQGLKPTLKGKARK